MKSIKLSPGISLLPLKYQYVLLINEKYTTTKQPGNHHYAKEIIDNYLTLSNIQCSNFWLSQSHFYSWLGSKPTKSVHLVSVSPKPLVICHCSSSPFEKEIYFREKRMGDSDRDREVENP